MDYLFTYLNIVGNIWPNVSTQLNKLYDKELAVHRHSKREMLQLIPLTATDLSVVHFHNIGGLTRGRKGKTPQNQGSRGRDKLTFSPRNGPSPQKTGSSIPYNPFFMVGAAFSKLFIKHLWPQGASLIPGQVPLLHVMPLYLPLYFESACFSVPCLLL